MSSRRIAVALAALFTAVGGYAGAVALAGMTLAPVWPVALAAALLAAVSYPLFRRLWLPLAGRAGTAAAMALHTVLATGLMMLLIYTVNRLTTSGADTLEGRVENISSITRQRTRRVGRGRYVASGDTYKVYSAEVTFPGSGGPRTLPLSTDEFLRLRRGDSVSVTVERGVFGMAMITGHRWHYGASRRRGRR